MGHRTVKRVPLDFDHPLKEVWPGFLREGRIFPPCPDCQHGLNAPMTAMDRLFGKQVGAEASGYSREAYAIAHTFYAHMIGGPLQDALAWNDKLGQAEVDMLAEENRLHDWKLWTYEKLAEPYELDEDGEEIRYKQTRTDRPIPTAAEVNASQGPGFMGHDGINRMLLVDFRCKLLGIEVYCPSCKGRTVVATDEEYEAEERASEEWGETEPPTGDGWQLWETTSEGSPVSPVFSSAGELAAWCEHNASPFADRTWTRDQWQRFIDADLVEAMSLMVTGPGMPPTTLGDAEDAKAGS